MFDMFIYFMMSRQRLLLLLLCSYYLLACWATGFLFFYDGFFILDMKGLSCSMHEDLPRLRLDGREFSYNFFFYFV